LIIVCLPSHRLIDTLVIDTLGRKARHGPELRMPAAPASRAHASTAAYLVQRPLISLPAQYASDVGQSCEIAAQFSQQH